MTETIEVRYKPIIDGSTVIYHKYIIYTNNLGDKFYARGGPAVGDGYFDRTGLGTSSKGEPFGNIVTETGEYDLGSETTPDKDLLDNHPRETIKSGSNLLSDFQAIVQAMNDIANENHTYTLRNSNSTVDTALSRAGLPQPTQDDLGENLAPGSGFILPNSLQSDPPNNLYSVALTILDFIGVVGTAISAASPLVFDLDDSGTIELKSLATSTAFWDIDQDGFAEKSGWVTGGDGLLALDLNENGKIDDNGELFGTKVTNGFSVLSAYDTDSDGKISSSDAVWSDLIMWRDSNEDGISDPSEMHSLSYFNITEISLNASEVTTTNQGHSVSHTSTFTVNDGINPPDTRIVHDVWFQHDNLLTQYAEGYEIIEAAAYLPNFRGYGNVADLHIAISQDYIGTGNLMSLVADISTKAFNYIFDDSTAYFDSVKSMMFRWAGVDGVSPTSRGQFIDARELEFIEEFMGQDYLQRGHFSDPASLAAEALKEAFYIAQNHVAARLMIEGSGGALFNGNWRYDIPTDSFTGITGINSTALSNLSTLATGAADLELFWQNVVRMIEFTVGVSNLSGGDQSALESAINGSNPALHLTDIVTSLDYEAPTGVILNGTSGANTLNGGVGNDELNGLAGADTLNGGVGNDVLDGGNDNDTLYGATGGDYLKGGAGNDTYTYNLGDGTDTIRESGTGTGNDADKIRFGSGVSSGHLTLSRIGNNDLVIDINTGSQTGKIIIEDQFNASGSVETLDFNGVSTLSLVGQSFTTYGSANADTINGIASGGLTTDTIYGYGGNDTIQGDAGNDVIYGGDGDDKVYGNNDNDTLYGDGGNDRLEGGSGNDTYYGGAGDDVMVDSSGDDTYYYVSGKDQIQEVATGTNLLILDAVWNGVTPQYLRIGSDLRIFFDSNNYITITNHFSAPVETLQYANATTVNLTTVSYVNQGTASGETLTGNASANTMYGLGGNDTMNGGDGNDEMYGGDGNDTMNGQNNDDKLYGEAGNDTLYGNAGNDYLEGGAGDDYMRGEADNDTYMYTSGIDRLYETGGTDVLKITQGYDLDDAVFVRRKDAVTGFNDLRVEFSSGNYAWIEEYFASAPRAIETVQFFDTTTVTLANLNFKTYGSSSADTINGVAVNGLTNDEIWGYDGNDTVSAGDGNDIVYGGNGNDSLTGGNGNDFLDGGAGDDTLVGGIGDDTFVYSGGTDKVSDSSSGAEVLKIANGWGLEDAIFTRRISSPTGSGDARIEFGGSDYVWIQNQFITANSVETLYFESTATSIAFSSIQWTLHGTSSAESLNGITSGGSINDIIYGYGGNDTIDGDTGDDVLYGGLGNDSLTGGSGNDTFVYDFGLDTVIESNTGTDALKIVGYSIDAAVFSNVSTYHTKITFSSGVDELTINNLRNTAQYQVETIEFDDGFKTTLPNYASWVTGTASGDTQNGTASADVIRGLAGNDTISGLAGNDALHGGAGNDTVNGGDGDDLVHGGVGDDTLYGNNNNDTLYGGDGLDNLYGGSGADTFMFLANSAYNNIDVIQDFSTAQSDKINLKDLLSQYDPVTEAITDFVQFSTSGSNTIVSVDADGGGNSFVQIATITGVTGLTDEAALVTSGNLVVA